MTANKRKEKLMEVPAAISVLDEATLERANVKEMDDLPNLSPALTISYSTQPGNFSINMRGIGTFSLGIGVEADVSVIIDDIPLALQANAFKDLADVARIEVLKGPQSTLFGKSAIAGALNITTRPITDEAKASLLLTSDGETRLGASYGAVVNDQFRMRISASTTDYPGVVRNLSDGGNLNGSKGQTVMAKLEWAPADDVTLTLAPRYNRQEKNCCVQPLSLLSPTNAAAGTPLYYSNSQFNIPANTNPALSNNNLLGGIPIGPRNVSVRNNYAAGAESTDYGVGFRVDYAPESGPLAKHLFSSITSYSKYEANDFQDGDAFDYNILQHSNTASVRNYANGPIQYGSFGVKSVTQEFRLVSPESQALRYVAGFWYAKNDLSRSLVREPFGIPYATNYATTSYNQSYALFGQATYDLTASTSLVAGLRLNRENTGYDYARTETNNGVGTLVSSRDDSESSHTGKLGLEHRFNKDVMAYGLYSTGHKGVAYDLVSGLTAQQAATFPIPSESAKNFEIGAKAMLLDNRASISVALFKTDFEDFQQSASYIDSATGRFVTFLSSIPAMQTKGVEVDGSFRVSREFQLNGSFAYTKAIYTDFANGPCYNTLNAAGTGQVLGPGCVTVTAPGGGTASVRDMKGLPLPNAPKYKFNVGGNYDIALAEQSFDLFVNGAYRWQDDVLFRHNQDPIGVTQKAYGILDAGFGLKDKKRHYTFTIFAKNLLDKLYAADLQYAPRNGQWSSSTVNVASQNWTPPRDYARYFGARLDLSF
ncbi:TonB-dependent receptor [Roseateles violae]|uniref:TonB-dependent receptor n=1 Tax=Roseateles violae TaxID=3058042 RepID=A0ABT8DN41_9BURK|nr:TonB-dependent receptor [Pelomonas sp. PFR6]MDN3919373.1 TonB-dependent receptor [Pelomonas sp. PFR6]